MKTVVNQQAGDAEAGGAQAQLGENQVGIVGAADLPQGAQHRRQ